MLQRAEIRYPSRRN